MGTDQYLVFRDTVQELSNVGAEYSTLKEAIEALNRAFERNPNSAAALAWQLEKAWVPKVTEFMQHWGRIFPRGPSRGAKRRRGQPRDGTNRVA